MNRVDALMDGLEPASAQDIADAITARDPRAVIDENFALLDELESWVIEEISRWQHVQEMLR